MTWLNKTLVFGEDCIFWSNLSGIIKHGLHPASICKEIVPWLLDSLRCHRRWNAFRTAEVTTRHIVLMHVPMKLFLRVVTGPPRKRRNALGVTSSTPWRRWQDGGSPSHHEILETGWVREKVQAESLVSDIRLTLIDARLLLWAFVRPASTWFAPPPATAHCVLRLGTARLG